VSQANVDEQRQSLATVKWTTVNMVNAHVTTASSVSWCITVRQTADAYFYVLPPLEES
jgi:hypothetical protein